MSDEKITRRGVLAAAGAAPFAASIDDARATQRATRAASAAWVVPATPADHLRTFLKLFVSLEAATVYYTYYGTLDAAVPGRGIVPLLATTSIVRRLVEPRPDGWMISVWEATVYHRAGEDEPLDSFVNPLNGRTVRPFHQREGRQQALWTANGQVPFRDAERQPQRGGGKPFIREWHVVADRVWTSRQSAGVYGRSTLDPVNWPLEFAGADLLYSEKTTNFGLLREIADSRVTNASSTYSLNQVMLWWPWLLMGQQPGFLVWNTHGVKLPSLDALPAPTRRIVERAHPGICGAGVPWEGQVSLWTEYPKQRTPVKD